MITLLSDFKDTPICGVKQHKCYSWNAYRYLNLNIASASADIIRQYNITYGCNCLQRCNSVTYSAEKKDVESQYNMIDEEEEEDFQDDENEPILLESGFKSRSKTTFYSEPQSEFVEKDNFAYLKFKIEFKKAQVLPYKRIAPYQVSDFIANCGGLLGLFMGISLLSVVEIIYFFTFRFIAAVQAVKAKESIRENEIDDM